MKNLKSLVKHPLAQGSFIVLLGNGVASFLNYLYHLITGRLLLPEQYGLLESLIALTYFLGVFTQAFSFSVINSVGKAKNFLVFSLVKALEKEALKLSFIFWFVFLILFPFLKKFLHLQNFLIFFIFSLQLFFSFLPAVYLSTLQARLKFVSFSLVGIISAFIKILSATFFILIGWQVKGALGSLLAAGIMLTFLTKFWVYKYWREEKIVPSRLKWTKDTFWRYSFLSLITTLALTSIYSSDILLVRHFFDASQSGIYSAVSILGKIIFFGASSILLVAFPLFTKFKDKKEKLKRDFYLSLLFIILISLGGIIIFKSFPQKVIFLLYGKGYREGVPFLPYFAIFVSLLAIFNLVIQFLLALENRLAAWIAGSVAITQLLLIIFRHDDLKIVIGNSVITLAFGLLFGFFFAMKVIGEKKD